MDEMEEVRERDSVRAVVEQAMAYMQVCVGCKIGWQGLNAD